MMAEYKASLSSMVPVSVFDDVVENRRTQIGIIQNLYLQRGRLSGSLPRIARQGHNEQQK